MPLTWRSLVPPWPKKVEPPKPVVPQEITLDDYWMGRAGDSRYVREWTFAVQDNAAELLSRVNRLLAVYGKLPKVVSGWRPYSINVAVRGAKNSAHLTGEAVDLSDADGAFKAWLRYNVDELAKANLYAEDFASTPTWVHLQTRIVASGKRIFKP